MVTSTRHFSAVVGKAHRSETKFEKGASDRNLHPGPKLIDRKFVRSVTTGSAPSDKFQPVFIISLIQATRSYALLVRPNQNLRCHDIICRW